MVKRKRLPELHIYRMREWWIKKAVLGIAIPGGKLSIVDDNGNEIKECDVIGELRYEGLNVTMGYADGSKDLEKPDERKGILLTGDMAKHDSEGYFYIVARKSRYIKIYGKRVSLDEIEDIIKSNYQELDCACIGEDNRIDIFITNSVYQHKVIEYLSNLLDLNQRIFNVMAIDTILKNNSSKIQYSILDQYMISIM